MYVKILSNTCDCQIYVKNQSACMLSLAKVTVYCSMYTYKHALTAPQYTTLNAASEGLSWWTRVKRSLIVVRRSEANASKGLSAFNIIICLTLDNKPRAYRRRLIHAPCLLVLTLWRSCARRWPWLQAQASTRHMYLRRWTSQLVRNAMNSRNKLLS